MKTLPLDDVVKRALTRPGQTWHLVLSFVPSTNEIEDCARISQDLPWLPKLGAGIETLFRDLRQRGLAVVACGDESEALGLKVAIRGSRLSGQVCKGRRAALQADVRGRHGIYATPPALTGYLARSVHRLLQAKLGWSGGLADPRVRLLDPAAGSMNFLRAAWRLALEADWHRGDGREQGDLVREHLLPHFLGIELTPEAHARGLASLRRFLRAYGREPAAEERLPAVLGDALGPAPEVLDFPANVVLGNPPWRGRSEKRGPWVSDLVADYYRLDGALLGEKNPKWLQDDAVRFLRLAQWKLDQAGEGIAALLLPHNGLDAPTFRGLRASLLASFEEIYAYDLHGNQRKREENADGGPDDNVFRGVAQGTAVFLLVKKPGLPKRVLRADLQGTRVEKLAALAGAHVGTTAWQEVEPRSPLYLFFPQEEERLEREYRQGLRLPEIFPLASTGVITGDDGLAVAFSPRALVDRLRELRALPPEDPRLDSAQRQALDQDADWPKRIVSFLVRPFDRRFLLYAHDFLERSRQKVMAHLERGGNLALLASRQSRGEPGVFVTRWIAGHKAASSYDVSSAFPLYLDLPEEGTPEVCPRVPNLAPALLASLAERYGEAPSPEEILGYVYAVLYDPTYRERYKTLLRRDFPRIPFARERKTFLHLATLGTELVGLHLLADRRLVVPPVDVVGDPTRRLGSGRHTLLRYEPKKSRLYVNDVSDDGLGFSGISPEVFRYRIGGYNVLAGWLTPRGGRVLLPEEILTFRRIASALTLTLEVQEKIAEAGGGYGEAS